MTSNNGRNSYLYPSIQGPPCRSGYRMIWAPVDLAWYIRSRIYSNTLGIRLMHMAKKYPYPRMAMH